MRTLSLFWEKKKSSRSSPHNVFGRCQHCDRAENTQNRKQRSQSVDAKTVAYILREWKASQDKQKEFLGSEYLDYNLVVALPNGRPCEETVISTHSDA